MDDLYFETGLRAAQKATRPHLLKAASVDAAIVMTLSDLQGFLHPLGIRLKKGEDPKGFSYIPTNLFSCALIEDLHQPRPWKQVMALDIFRDPFERYLEVAHQLAHDCNPYQRDLIETIVRDLLEQRKAYEQKFPDDRYVTSRALGGDSDWSKAVRALAQAFNIPLTQ